MSQIKLIHYSILELRGIARPSCYYPYGSLVQSDSDRAWRGEPRYFCGSTGMDDPAGLAPKRISACRPIGGLLRLRSKSDGKEEKAAEQ
jgi:hypothetical protein